MKEILYKAIILSILLHVCNTSMSIWQPTSQAEYFANTEIVYSIASFGRVPYGHSIIGKVVLANPLDACEPVTLSFPESDKTGSLIVQATRGNCPFAKKAYNVQNAGGSLQIYADSIIEDVSKIIPKKEKMNCHTLT